MIIKKLKELGYNTAPAEFYYKVAEWKSWYVGDVKGFHDYKVRNSGKVINCRRFGLNMAKKITEDWGGLLMNEKVKITLEGEKEQDFVDSVFIANNFAVKANEMQELKAALGTVAYIPRVVGQAVDATGAPSGNAQSISLDYVTVENIYPLRWENGIIRDCAFTSAVYSGDKEYVYLQIHEKNNAGTYDIGNRVYLRSNGNLTEVELAEVPGYELIPPVVHTGSTERQFVIDRLNIANNFDYTLPLGIAVYANSVDALKGVDINYDSYVNEFILGKKRIMVKPAATKYLDGEPIFDSGELVFYVLPEDVQDDNIIHEIDMTLRTEEHSTGIQNQLNLLSSKCGLGENYYRFDRGSVATATQVISENSAMFRTLKKHEVILRDALTELCRIILRLGNMAMGLGLDEDVEISIDFDDSIIEDKNADFNRDMQLLASGILNDWEFRAKWLNEDEETAKAALPGAAELTTEEQDEIE